jgi:hypothetical protein
MFRHTHRHPPIHLAPLRAHRLLHRAVVGGALILFGIAFLLRNQGLIGPVDPWLLAPAAIALSALARIARRPDLSSLGEGAANLAIAAYLVVVIEHVGGWTFATTWPVLLIVAGVALVARALAGGRGRRERGL